MPENRAYSSKPKAMLLLEQAVEEHVMILNCSAIVGSSSNVNLDWRSSSDEALRIEKDWCGDRGQMEKACAILVHINIGKTTRMNGMKLFCILVDLMRSFSQMIL